MKWTNDAYSQNTLYVFFYPIYFLSCLFSKFFNDFPVDVLQGASMMTFILLIMLLWPSNAKCNKGLWLFLLVLFSYDLNLNSL